MRNIDYPEPRGPHGYMQGGLAYGGTSNASAGDNQGDFGQGGMGGGKFTSMRSQYRMRQPPNKNNLPRQVSSGQTNLQTTLPSFGIPNVTNRVSPPEAGFGAGTYPGPIQNAGYAGALAMNPILDPSFGGGGGIPYDPSRGSMPGGYYQRLLMS